MSLSKHLVNPDKNVVVESLQGLVATNHQLALDVNSKVVYKKNVDKSKVHIICGGGAGHEPSHAGFVGEGILSAAVCGNVFASPNSTQVRRGIDLVDNDRGTIIIVKNYTGDILNFGLAKERHAAQHPSKADKVKFLVVGDDVAVGRAQGSIVGRRGLAGVVLVYKIAGALAAQGASLDEVYDVATWVASRVGTIGVGLEHCHVPGTAVGEAHLGKDEIEIGLGIHNEPGNKRLSPVPPLNDVITELLEPLTSTKDSDRSFLPFQHDGKDEVVLFVNNLGGLSELELGGIVGATSAALAERKIKVQRTIAGSFMTSLNMPGFSLTVLLLPRAGESPSQEQILSLLDAKAETSGWKWTSNHVPSAHTETAVPESSTDQTLSRGGPTLSASDPKIYLSGLERAVKAIIEAEPEITRMDTIAGDGDCGLTLRSGATAVLENIKSGKITGQNLVSDMVTIADVAQQQMDGTSGALYCIYFSALAQALQTHASKNTANPQIWSEAVTSALDKLYTYTRARRPSRTLIDPLSVFVESLPQGFTEAVKSAAVAAEATKDVEAKAGRSAYVEGGLIKKVADPGAWGVKVILEALGL